MQTAVQSVYSLALAFYFLWFILRSQKWCSSVRIILLNKTCEYHKWVFATEIIFSVIQNQIQTSQNLVVEGTSQGDANFWFSLKKNKQKKKQKTQQQ